MKRSEYELLAPAGNLKSFIAAINAGADAIYAGTDRFSARAYADNLTSDEYISGIRLAHLHGVNVYLTLNTLINPAEYDDVFLIVRTLYESGLDGIIVQDLGLAGMLREAFPELKLHASTQMSIMSEYGAKLAKDAGYERVVPARELTLKEIRQIRNKAEVEVECFIHGSMCYSYSGLCLMSSMIGERSGNRGRCAGTCRLPFMLSYEDIKINKEEYPLSMKDLCSLDILPLLIDADIDSFKIEGRMKSPEYVAGVTRIYRRYIDMYLEKGRDGFKVSKEDRDSISSLYLRTDLSIGYLEGYKGKNLITIDKPGYNGADKEAEEEITNEYVQSVEDIETDMYLSLKTGKPAELTVNHGDIYAAVTGDTVQEAKNAPITQDFIHKCLSKTGGSGYKLGKLDADTDENVFLTAGSLNSLRRSALEALTDEIIQANGYRHKRECGRDITSGKTSLSGSKHVRSAMRRVKEAANTLYDIQVSTIDQLKEALKLSNSPLMGSIIADYGLIFDPAFDEILDKQESLPETALSFPAILRSPECDDKFKAAYDRIDSYVTTSRRVSAVLVHTLDELKFVLDKLPDIRIMTGPHIYVHNTASAKYISDVCRERLQGITLPYELNRKDLTALTYSFADTLTSGEISMIVYGNIPMMITAGCVKKTYDHCDHKRSYEDTPMLKDRKRKSFPVFTDCSICTNTIFNERPLCLYDMMNEVSDIGADRYRIVLTTEDSRKAEEILSAFMSKHDRSEYFKAVETTTGHFRRGAI